MPFTNADLRKISHDYRLNRTIKKAERVKIQIMESAEEGKNSVTIPMREIAPFMMDVILHIKKDYPEIIYKNDDNIIRFTWEITENPKPSTDAPKN